MSSDDSSSRLQEGYAVTIEPGAGVFAGFSDEAYVKATSAWSAHLVALLSCWTGGEVCQSLFAGLQPCVLAISWQDALFHLRNNAPRVPQNNFKHCYEHCYTDN
jgi:hypothetical protein